MNTFHSILSITESCNLNCIHCKTTKKYSGYQPSLNLIIKRLEKLAEGGCNYIKITGGEPFIRKDIWKILDKIEELNMSSAFSTNGTILSEYGVKMLKKYPKMRGISISMGGATEAINDSVRGKGVYKKIMDTVNWCKKYKIQISLCMILLKQNYRELPKFIDLCSKLNVGLWIITWHPWGRWDKASNFILNPRELKWVETLLRDKFKKNLNEMIKLCKTKDGTCDAGRTSPIFIDVNGTVHPCLFLYFPVGNIDFMSIEEIKQTIESNSVLRAIRDKKLKGKYASCEIRNICGGGCRADTFCLTGNLLGEYPLCWYKESDKKDKTLFPRLHSAISDIKLKNISKR